MIENVAVVAKDIAAVIGCASTVITLAVTTIKPLRKHITNMIREVSKTDVQQVQLNNLKDKIQEVLDLMNQHIEEDKTFNSQISESMKDLKDGSAISLGNIIKEIYNAHKTDKQIPEKEMEIVDKAYLIYHDRLHANGVIERIYLEMTNGIESGSWITIID